MRTPPSESHRTLTRRDFVIGSVATSFAAVASLTLSGVNAMAEEQADEMPISNDLADEEIAARFERIRTSYQVGESLSDDDAAFVQSYSSSQLPVTRGSQSFYMVGSTTDVYAVAQGTAYHNGTFNYTFGASVTVNNQSGVVPKWMKFKVTCDSFGAGQNGGTIFQGTHSCETSKHYGVNSFYDSIEGAYSGVTAYWNLTLELSGTGASGNYFSKTY